MKPLPNTTRPPAAAYSSGISGTALLGETVDGNLRRTVAQYGARDALVDVASGRRLTYRQLDDAVEEVARGLIAQGVGRGDRVGIWAPNCVEWFLVQYATARIGAVQVNVNPAYRAEELRYALSQSGVDTLITATAFKTSNYRAMVADVSPSLPKLRNVIFIGDRTWETLIAAGRSVTNEQVATRSRSLSFDDPINIQYTSGTTGSPKGVTLTHHSILNNGFFVGELNGYTADDRICVPVPFYHCFGMVMGNLAATSHGGGHGDPGTKLFDAESRRCGRSSCRDGAPRSTGCRRCSSPSWACPGVRGPVRPEQR